MNRLRFLLYLSLVWLQTSTGRADLTPQPTVAQKPTVILAQGEQRLLRIPNLVRYSIGSPILRAIFPNPPHTHHSNLNLLLIKGISPGITDLWIWKQDGSTEIRNIRVIAPSALSKKSTTVSSLDRALEKLDEAEIIFTGNGIVLRGEIRVAAEVFRIGEIARTFPKEVMNETWPSASLLEKFKNQLEEWIQKTLRSSRLKDSNLQLDELGQTLWLRGNAPTLKERVRLEKEALNVYPFLQVDLENLPDPSRTVHFRVFLLEVKQNKFSSRGLSWPAQLEATLTLPGGTATSASLEFGQLKWILNQLEGKGQARILSQPELVVRAPGEAELFAGGEIPIQMQSRFYSNVNWRNYGLTLRLKITHAVGSRIRLDILTEISHLDRQVSQDGIPGIQVNRMKTQVDAQLDRPLFLSGLFQHGIRQEAKGFPFLRNLPVLGALFRSEDYLNERSELAAILLPSESLPTPRIQKNPKSLPKGLLPPPRDWMDPEHEKRLRESEEFPWNAF